MSKIIEILKKDDRSVEVMIEYKDGRQMKHYMTRESYDLHLKKEYLIKKDNITEADLDSFQNAVRNDYERDSRDNF